MVLPVYVLVLATIFVQKQIDGGSAANCTVTLVTIKRCQDHANSSIEEAKDCCAVTSNSTIPCESFTHALDLAPDSFKNHTLINVRVNVTIDVELSMFITLKNLHNVTIIGHNSPTISCSNGGGLQFSCYNCTIEGVTWDGCGASNRRAHPVLWFRNSSNITIQNCSFQHSIGQAVVLSGVSGDVSINHCKFVDNIYYRGHGVAIHYSSDATDSSKFVLTISHCNFSYNTHGKLSAVSTVHIEKSSLRGTIIVKDSLFDNNRGNAIYATRQNLHIYGTVVFRRNKAKIGGGIFATNSNITFGKMSRVTFIENEVTGKHGGAIFVYDHSKLQFEQKSVVVFNGNKARTHGGAVYLGDHSTILFDKNSNTTFLNNSATSNGGAVNCNRYSKVVFKSISAVSFNNNTAVIGGALYSNVDSMVVFEENTTVSFNGNTAKDDGGGLVIQDDSAVLFKDNTTVIFTSHKANAGAAIRSNGNCNITFTENSNVTFKNNAAYSGGAVHSQDYGNMVFEGNSRVTFDNNTATDGGSLYLHTESDVIFKGRSYVTFYNNTAGTSGGAVYAYGNSDIIIIESAVMNFTHNVAKTGGAIYATICNITISGTSKMTLNNNEAVHEGGAVYLSDQTSILFDTNIDMTIAANDADYGAGVYNNLAKNTSITFNAKELSHYNNTARVAGSLMYVHIPPSCDRSCLDERIVISDGTNLDVANYIATPPEHLELYDPTIPTCDDSKNNAKECNTYYVGNVMLGQEILIDSCLIDYYNKPSDQVVQFSVTHDIKDFTPGSEYVLVSCSLPLKFSITGSRRAPSVNYTMTLSTFSLGIEDRIPIHVNITVSLSPCHPGFQFNPRSQKCECFNHDIVFCSGSSSFVHKGYWFGEVNGKLTAGICPVSYCDFTSCNAAINLCHLSPERANQCKSHRSGSACGNCEKGYTLPFYSTECINEDNCTILQTAIVIVLTVVYWIALVIVVFITMYYKVSIGYLYAITYYYSIVDVLLSEYLHIPQGLYITINIMYSIIKLTPQFLGKLCLVRGLSGIDQQFIHYIHPLAISLMLVMIVMLTKFSRRLSAFISRGIIRVICFLLLLSYTSVTITSLLLVRQLRFVDVDKIYTYLSPNIEYFQGRHLAYGIIALLCIIFIVIGVPLVLIAEPFLNHKISFTRVKPLLDQFQGCYKDKYRWFAGYYMICRIVVIIVAIIFASTDFSSHYFLIVTCAAILLIHVSVRPYTSKILNAFDGILLLLLTLLSILLLVEFVNSNSVVQVTFVLLMLPVVIFLALCLYTHKDAIKKLNIYVNSKNKNKRANNNNLKSPAAKNDVDLTIDDSMRMNATICDVHLDNHSIKDDNQYRESFLEVMDEIQD